MFQKKSDQTGFITMIVIILAILITVIVVAYLQVAKVNK